MITAFKATKDSICYRGYPANLVLTKVLVTYFAESASNNKSLP